MTTQSTDHLRLYTSAVAAGMRALAACKPEPMVIGSAVGLSNRIDTTQPIYIVDDGACGFAWVNVKPGNSAFAKWLVKNGHARKDSYYGGVTVWVTEGGQSIGKKEAYANVFARVLTDAGIRAYAASRLD